VAVARAARSGVLRNDTDQALACPVTRQFVRPGCAWTNRFPRLVSTSATPATLPIVGLLRRDDGGAPSQATLDNVTPLLARSLRGDDWLASSGPAELVIVLSGSVTGAEAATARLVAAVAALGIPDLSARPASPR
jgi:hypothetical protein